MAHREGLTRQAGLGLIGIALLAAGVAPDASAQHRGRPSKDDGEVTGASGWVNPLKKRYIGESYEVCDQGAFFVGGVPKVTNYAGSADSAGPPQQITIGQSYVQFQIPKKRRKWPLVMIHGSTHTGAALDATPDGREGWFPYAVRHGLATFVMDQPGRGRSGFDNSAIHESWVTGDTSLMRTISRITDNGAWTTWFGHIVEGLNILDGTMIRHGDPGDPDPPDTAAVGTAGHGDYPPAYPIPPVPFSIDPRAAEREGAIGEEPNQANWDYLALTYYKQLVPNGENTLPGSVCETCDPQEVAPSNTWSPLAMAELIEGLGGAIVSPHSQSGTQVFHLVRVMRERGTLHLIKGIIIPESGGTQFEETGTTPQDFDHIPFLLLNGDYRPDATREVNRAAIEAMNASPTRSVSPAAYFEVEDPIFAGRLNGTTHMEMVGTTSLAIFDFFLEWAEENIDNPWVRGGDHCRDRRHGDRDRDRHRGK